MGTTVHAYWIRDNGTRAFRQQLRAGHDPVEIAVTSSNTEVGQITTSPVVFTPGQAWQLTEFQPLTVGTTTITMVHPEGFTVASDARTNLTATVTAG